MRPLLCAALVGSFLAPTLAHAYGKPRVQGYTRKELAIALALRMDDGKLLLARVGTKKFTRSIIDLPNHP
jgi:hypothetical protein